MNQHHLRERYTGYAMIAGCLIALAACYLLISAIIKPKMDWMCPAKTQIEIKL